MNDLHTHSFSARVIDDGRRASGHETVLSRSFKWFACETRLLLPAAAAVRINSVQASERRTTHLVRACWRVCVSPADNMARNYTRRTVIHTHTSHSRREMSRRDIVHELSHFNDFIPGVATRSVRVRECRVCVCKRTFHTFAHTREINIRQPPGDRPTMHRRDTIVNQSASLVGVCVAAAATTVTIWQKVRTIRVAHAQW